MKSLVLGSGAREHAIITALRRDAGAQVWAAPGNAGIAADIPTRPVDIVNPAAVVALAQELAPDLVVVGPEAPLVAGVSDALRAAGFAVFGPSLAAARIEGSKSFAKDVMSAAGVPTAAAATCTTLTEVEAALNRFGTPHVVKDDGLAAGKGVVVTSSTSEALTHAQRCLVDGGTVVVEEFLDGPEVSLFGVTDGRIVVPLAPAQDFKRVSDGDLGPNTGGMGAYSPLPWAPPELVPEVVRTVLQPTIDELARRGTPFSGLLYAGLAVTERGIRVIEFNARFGDPETQVVLARLESSLGELLLAAATGRLSSLPELQWSDTCAVTVVMAAAGYPEAPRLGASITGLDDVSSATVFHAGTAVTDGQVVVAGGRVLSVTAVGRTLDDARDNAYRAAEGIAFEGAHFRTDIALHAARGEIKVPVP